MRLSYKTTVRCLDGRARREFKRKYGPRDLVVGTGPETRRMPQTWDRRKG